MCLAPGPGPASAGLRVGSCPCPKAARARAYHHHGLTRLTAQAHSTHVLVLRRGLPLALMEDAAAVCGMELGSLGGEPLSLSSQSLKRPGEHGLSTSTGADTDSHSGSDGTNDRDLGESKRAASARPFEEGLGMDLDEDHRMFSPHADSSAGFEKLGASEGSRLHTRRDSSANLLNFLEEGDPSSSTASKRKLNQVSDAQMDGDGSNVPSAAHQPGSRQARDPALDEQARYYTKTITGLGRENYFLKQQFAIANSQVMQLSQELAIVHEQLHSLRLLVAKMPSRQALVPPEQRMVSQCVRYALDCSASGSGAAASGMGMMDGIGNGGMEGGGMVGMGQAYSSMDMHSTQQNQPPLPPHMHRHLFKEGQTAASGGGQDAHVHDASHMQRGRKLYRAAGDMPEVALLAAHERSAVDKAFSYRGESGVMGWNDAWMMRSSRGLGTEASLDHGPTTSRQMDHEEAVQHEASATAAAAAAAQHVSAAGGVGEAGACQAAHTAKDSERASAQRSTQAEGNQANEEPPSGARESSADVKGSEGSKRDGGTSGGDTEGGKEKEVGKASSKKEGGARDKGSEKGESGGQPRFWTADEHKRFLEAVRLYGYGNARHIAAYVQTRNITQVRTHAQKYILKLSRMGSAPNKVFVYLSVCLSVCLSIHALVCGWVGVRVRVCGWVGVCLHCMRV